MEYTVNRLAKLAGVSARTLRYYDEIGLLRPERVSSSGYRIYGKSQVNRLQQILFYRELGVELAQIARLLDDPGFDAVSALESHLAELNARRARLDALIGNARRSLQALKGEDEMSDKQKFEGFKQNLLAENERKYGAEIRQKYGEETVQAANAKLMNMTEEEYAAMNALSEELNATLKAAFEKGDPAGPLAQKAAALHREWLYLHWPRYNAEAHKNLAQMYVDDERFAAYYNEIAPDCAPFLRDAVAIYCDGQT